jgi:hypothetical protein
VQAEHVQDSPRTVAIDPSKQVKEGQSLYVLQYLRPGAEWLKSITVKALEDNTIARERTIE